MTLDELSACEEIRKTLAAHNQAGDGDDAQAWAATFTDDAKLATVGLQIFGREALLQWKVSHKIFATTAHRNHHVSNTLIDLVSADSALVTSNWLVITDIGLDHSGRYRDRFRKTGDGWLIAQREIEIIWRADNGFLVQAQEAAGRA